MNPTEFQSTTYYGDFKVKLILGKYQEEDENLDQYTFTDLTVYNKDDIVILKKDKIMLDNLDSIMIYMQTLEPEQAYIMGCL